ncbi:MAG: hypothetical protein Q8R83_08630 [Legionellaceae bacterium]|nr:hypothetical protein [Legionellaceae bacterium]
MNKAIVSPTFLKQRARQLKKEKSLSQHQAYDEAAKESGYAGYKHYRNTLETTPKCKEALLENIYSEKDMFKKVELAVAFVQNFKIPFHEQLDILKLFQNSEEDAQFVYEKLSLDSGLHDLIQPWLQFVCEKLNFMKDEIQSHLLKDFLLGEGKDELHNIHPYFIAKEVSISELMYEIAEDTLRVFEADYKLKLKFDFENVEFENEEDRKDSRFNDREMFGSFGVTIARNKEITFEHSDIGEESGDGFFESSFR